MVRASHVKNGAPGGILWPGGIAVRTSNNHIYICADLAVKVKHRAGTAQSPTLSLNHDYASRLIYLIRLAALIRIKDYEGASI